MKRIIAKLSIIMLIITAVFGAESRVSAEEYNGRETDSTFLSQEEKDEVGEILLSMLEASTSKTTRSALSNVSAEVQATITAKAEAVAALEAASGDVFDEITHNVDIRNASIDSDGNLNVDVYDTAVIWYHSGDSEEPTDYCAYGTWHDVTLEKVDGEWFVVRDSFDERMITGIASEDVILAEENADSLPVQDVQEQPEGNRGMNTINFSYNSTKLKNAIKYAIQYCGMTST